MEKNLTIARDANKIIPLDFFKKATSQGYNKSWGVAIAHNDGDHIITRKTVAKEVKPEDLDNFQKFKEAGIPGRQIFLCMGNGESLHEEDQQPYTLLHDDSGEKPALVAFLNGDFSQHRDEASSHSDAYFCVQTKILPSVTAIVNNLGESASIEKIMEVLKQDDVAHIWANFMSGKEGSITIVACNGDSHTIHIKDDPAMKTFDGWWTSNALGYGESLLSGLAADLGGAVKSAIPKLRIPGKPKADGKTSAVTALEQAKPAPSASPAPPGDGARTEPGGEPAPHPELPAELGDPDAKLTITVPPGMETRRAVKWWQKRVPEGMMPKVITGIKTITCKRSEATPTFLQTYMEQNKLGGLDVLKLKSTTAAVASSHKPDTAAAKPSGGVPKIHMPGKKDQAAPAKAEDHRQPTAEPSKKDAAPHVVGKPDAPQVVTDPQPILSPLQRDEAINFMNAPEVKAGRDRTGRAIADPKGVEELNKNVEPLEKQLGGLFSVLDFARCDYSDKIRLCNSNAMLAAKVLHFVSMELLSTNKMLDELTGPHVRPNEKPEAVQQPAKGTNVPPRIRMPARKAG